MRIVIITERMPPCSCGIGDYTGHIAEALRVAGCEVAVVAGRGQSAEDICIVDGHWDGDHYRHLFDRLDGLRPDLVLIQFTPLMYRSRRSNAESLAEFWKQCSSRWRTAMIVHETYFRVWWYPPSWIRGALEKSLLKRMVGHSRFVFSASEPLVEEMTAWSSGANISLLPLGSNFPEVNIDRGQFRHEKGIGGDEVVLVLFGGGNSVKWMHRHVEATERLLLANGIVPRWLLLGGVNPDWFSLQTEAMVPGWLPAEEISAWLWAADIFLVPHYAGLNGKRGTLTAAMQHELPVVGTQTGMTDACWHAVEGVVLVPLLRRGEFAERTLELAGSASVRQKLGKQNRRYYHDHFQWSGITRSFMSAVTQ